MKSRIVKTFAIAALATTLAACSSTKTTTDTGSTGTQTGAVMDPFNPNSPLAQQRSVFFGFDQYNVDEQYLPLVQMHAQYLAAKANSVSVLRVILTPAALLNTT